MWFLRYQTIEESRNSKTLLPLDSLDEWARTRHPHEEIALFGRTSTSRSFAETVEDIDRRAGQIEKLE